MTSRFYYKMQRPRDDKYNLLTKHIDLALKLISILFIICIVTGTLVVLVYFSDNQIISELPSILSTPNTLILLSTISLLLWISIILIMMVVPYIISQFQLTYIANRKQDNSVKLYITRFFLIYLYPLISATIFSYHKTTPLLFFSLISLISLVEIPIFIFICNSKKPTLKEFSLYFYQLFSAHFLLIYPLIFMMKLVAPMSKDDLTQWEILIAVFIFYSLASSCVYDGKNIKSYFFLITVTLIILLISFASHIPDNIIEKTGIGSYEKTIYLDDKYSSFLCTYSQININIEDKKHCKLNNIWIVASLPNKIVFKTDKNDNQLFSLPTSSILAEISSKK